MQIHKKTFEQFKINIDSLPILFSDIWVNPDNFPYFERPEERHVIGRVSSSKPSNYSNNFPTLIEYIKKDEKEKSFKNEFPICCSDTITPIFEDLIVSKTHIIFLNLYVLAL